MKRTEIKNRRRLSLSPEKLRTLSSVELGRAAGGSKEPTIMNTHCYSCASYCETDD